MSGQATRTNLFDLHASRVRFVRRCASNAAGLLAQVDRADDAKVADDAGWIIATSDGTYEPKGPVPE